MTALAPTSVFRRWLPIALATSVLSFAGLLAWLLALALSLAATPRQRPA